MIQTLTLAAVVATAAVVGAWSVSAATVTSANDFPSTLQTSQAANHRVLFTTPTGVSEGSTFTLTFASSFDTSMIIEDDVDVADDGVDLTTASSCGSAQASVAIASDIVTITICVGGGGAIAANSAVAIEIGTNATSSGTGANQMTNPSSTGNYYVSIAGTFGDSGSIILPIGGDDSFSVTATVPSSGGGGEPGGGGGGGAPVDVTAPTISDIVVSAVTTSTATITWATSEAATRFLDYGITTSFELGTETVSGYYTSHSVALMGLSEGQTYYFRIRAVDIAGNSATSTTQSFTTLDETDPVISEIEVVDITTTSARVTWTTNESADSTVSYGLTSSYSETETDSSLVTSHSILLTDLTSGTTYHFQVLSTDASSNQAFSSDDTFTTDDDDAPGNVSNLSIVEGDEELTLSWTNPTDEDLAGILVLQCLDTYPSTPSDEDCVSVSTALGTSLFFDGLTNGTTYYFGVFPYDDAGQFASGALESGTPSAPDIEVLTDVCGDAICSGSEDAVSCSVDCSIEPPGGEVCGDGFCTETETATSCPVDCDTPIPSSCGDATCSADESSLTCAVDCGEAEEPTSLGAEEGDLSDAEVLFLVADETIEITTTSSGVVEVTPTSDVRIVVSADAVLADVEMITLTVGDDTYLMRLDDALDLYYADITIPNATGLLSVEVLVTYEDGSTDSVSSYLRVVSQGYVYQVIDGEEAGVSSATVMLFEYMGGEWVVWDGSPYDQFNPIDVEEDGTFIWYVPNGTYQVSASADGFETATSATLTIDNAIVNPRIRLTASEQEVSEIVPTHTEEVPSVTSIPESPLTLAETFFNALPIAGVQETLEAIRELPGVEEVARISTPALAITAGASVIVLAVAFDFLPFLQYFFTAPVLFFWRRRRKEYGIVYNAIAKTPIDLAVVRLFKIDDEAANARGRLVQSRVTDKGGRYFFLVQPGRYRITITKSGFTFPSEYLKEERTDGAFLDVYHGEIVEVTLQNALVTANIPLDPSQAAKYHEPAFILRRKLLSRLQQTVAIIGVVMAIVFAVIRPTTFSVAMVAVQILIYLLARRLARPHKPISWGIVYHKETGRPLSQVVARVFEPKYNKLLETQVTDSRGRFAFILGPNTYYATFDKAGYKQKQIDPIDYSAAKEPKGFSENVPLESEDQPKTE